MADADSRSVQSVLGRTNARIAVLLALLVLAAVLGVARIGGGHTSSDHLLTVAHPQRMQHHLDAMALPSGFQRVACPGSSKPSVCLKRFPSVVLAGASWAQIIDHLGVPVTRSLGCGHPRYLWIGHPTAVKCFAFAHLGQDQIWIDAVDVVLVTRAGLRSTSGNFGSFTGTLIRITDVGN